MTSPLSLETEFWRTDGKCLLLNRNNGYLTEETASERCASFVSFVKGIDALQKYDEIANAQAKATGSAEFDRIFEEDAKRTFTSTIAQTAEVNTLRKVFAHTQDYHQGLGFLVAFLRLFLGEEDTVRVCCYLSDTSCEGYFKLENEEYLRDCYTLDELLMRNESAISFKESDTLATEEDLYSRIKQAHNKLQQSTFTGQYLSKWIIGFCIHVFPFEAIIRLLERVMTEPEKTTWYAFATAFIIATSDDVLKKAKGTSQILQVLKFDNKLYPDSLTIGELCPSLDLEDSSIGAHIWIVNFSEAITFDPDQLGEIWEVVDDRLKRQQLAKEEAAAAAAALEGDDSDFDDFSSSDDSDDGK